MEDTIIKFGPTTLKDVTTPYDDALVVWATIANYNMARVCIDSGSFVNILFKEAFDCMQVDQAELQPMPTSLFGFVRHKVKLLEQINLPLSLEEVPLRKTRTTIYIVVEVALAYNVISTMVSTCHQKVKFPVSG